MSENISPLAGKPVPPSLLTNIPRLITAYYALAPDPGIKSQRVAFGTSGHRGSAFAAAFNETHILAIAQAVCLYRHHAGIDGPLFLGMDTHALSEPAFASAVEVLAANGVETMIDQHGGYTPTPVISHAILTYNRGRKTGLADGIVISPSHNPPDEGGFKYNPANGGPADIDVTGWIEKRANEFLAGKLAGVQRISYQRARKAACIHAHDYITPYVADLGNVVDMEAIRSAGVRIGIDPLGGAAVHYWQPIIERYKIAATVVNDAVDPTFRFMTVDWDGKIRMDCSSPYAMTRLVAMGDKFDVAFANDTDADRHGIVCPSSGLMNPNYYLAAAISYLYANRPGWRGDSAVGKTAVSSAHDRSRRGEARAQAHRGAGRIQMVQRRLAGRIAGLRRRGERRRLVPAARRIGLDDGQGRADHGPARGRDHRAKRPRSQPSSMTSATHDLGKAFYQRIDAPASADEKVRLAKIAPEQFAAKELAGEPITAKLTRAPGNNQPLGGIKVVAKNGWFAARPSGTEDVYKIYAESFRGEDHLKQIQSDAQAAISDLLSQPQ